DLDLAALGVAVALEDAALRRRRRFLVAGWGTAGGEREQSQAEATHRGSPIHRGSSIHRGAPIHRGATITNRVPVWRVSRAPLEPIPGGTLNALAVVGTWEPPRATR